jgi:hypothetical protein
MLGHATITVTMDLYGHLFPGMAQDVSDRMGAAFGETAAQMRPTEPEGALVLSLPETQKAL